MANVDQARSRWGRRRQDPPPPPAEEAEAIRRTEAATDDIGRNGDMGDGTATDETEIDSRPDPAPSAGAIAEERALQLVANITTQAQGELRGLREQLDDLMREMAERRGMLVDAIRAHAEFAEASIQHKLIIGESIAKLRADFERSRTPLPPTRNV